jgi:hypothetical protein
VEFGDIVVSDEATVLAAAPAEPIQQLRAATRTAIGRFFGDDHVPEDPTRYRPHVSAGYVTADGPAARGGHAYGDQIDGPSWGVDVPVRYDYRAIMEDIQDKVARGEWPAGFKLPTPRELAVQYGVSPATIRKATDNLQLLGVLEGHQGVGVFVADRK